MPKVKVIQPFDIEPMILDTEAHRSGQATHRRVISKIKDGSQSMDAGYNTYKKGVSLAAASHAIDQICYIVSGEGEIGVDGEIIPLRAGMFQFRPAGAKITFACHTDMVTVCFFAPPRM
jgi:ethanolamine utilization protein EutQ (cupin superfamily)